MPAKLFMLRLSSHAGRQYCFFCVAVCGPVSSPFLQVGRPRWVVRAPRTKTTDQPPARPSAHGPKSGEGGAVVASSTQYPGAYTCKAPPIPEKWRVFLDQTRFKASAHVCRFPLRPHMHHQSGARPPPSLPPPSLLFACQNSSEGGREEESGGMEIREEVEMGETD